MDPEIAGPGFFLDRRTLYFNPLYLVKGYKIVLQGKLFKAAKRNVTSADPDTRIAIGINPEKYPPNGNTRKNL